MLVFDAAMHPIATINDIAEEKNSNFYPIGTY